MPSNTDIAVFSILLLTNVLIGTMKEASGYQKSSVVPPAFACGYQGASKMMV